MQLLIMYKMRQTHPLWGNGPWVEFCGLFRSLDYFLGHFTRREAEYRREVGDWDIIRKVSDEEASRKA